MALAFARLGTGFSDSTNTTSWGTGSYTFTAGRFYLAAIVNTVFTSSNLRTPSLTGATSGAWTAVSNPSFDTTGTSQNRLTVRSFLAGSTFSEALTIATATTHLSVCMEILEISGQHASSPLVQFDPDAADSATAFSGLALSSFADAVNNGCVVAAATSLATPGISASGSYTLLTGSVVSADPASINWLYVTGEDTAPNPCTVSSSNIAAVACEIAVAAGGGGTAKAVLGHHLRTLMAG